MATGASKAKWNGNGNGLADLEQTLPVGSQETVLWYEGKRSENEILSTRPARLETLWQDERHAGTANRLYYGDNLPILASLRHDPSVCGKVKLIYIDPPFATRSVFQSRSQEDAYHDLLSGAQYIEFLRTRLILLRELLAKDGSIYVHLDENMAFQIKVIMDEVFGPRNFRNWITRKLPCRPSMRWTPEEKFTGLLTGIRAGKSILTKARAFRCRISGSIFVTPTTRT